MSVQALCGAAAALTSRARPNFRLKFFGGERLAAAEAHGSAAA
jgi:hypothetical protein